MGETILNFDPLSSILFKPYNSSFEKCDLLGRPVTRDTSSLTDRLLSFQESDINENEFPFKFASLAGKGYHIIPPYIACSECSFKIEYTLIKDNSSELLDRHNAFKSDCPNVLNEKPKHADTKHIDSELTTAGAAAKAEIIRPASTAATGYSNVQLCPSQLDSRLPVPVNVKSNQGRLAADSVLQVRTSNSDPNPPVPDPEPQLPRMLRNEAPSRRTTFTVDRNKPLALVRKPVCRNSEYDTYEGRLGTFYDWPRSNPMIPEELARAGFYYVHNNDKVKCPYCLGGIYNWEPNDNALSEHMRHNPKCEFLKWFAYTTLTSPIIVPNTVDPTANDSLENHAAVKGLHVMGYDLDIVLKVIKDNKLEKDSLTSVAIMEGILALEEKLGKSLINENTDDDNVETQGAVGGQDLNMENQATFMCSVVDGAVEGFDFSCNQNCQLKENEIDVFKEHVAVQALERNGYDLKTVLMLIKCNHIAKVDITTDLLLHHIFAFENKSGTNVLCFDNEEEAGRPFVPEDTFLREDKGEDDVCVNEDNQDSPNNCIVSEIAQPIVKQDRRAICTIITTKPMEWFAVMGDMMSNMLR